MRSASGRLLPILLFFLLFVACKNTTSPTVEKNPIFESDPRMKQITDAIFKNPTDASLYFTRGKMLYKLKQDTLALNDYKKAAELDTTKAEYLSAIGDLLFENKDIEGSVSWFQKAIAKNPKEPTAHLKIAKLFLYAQDYKKALEQLNIVQRQNIYNPETYFLEGMIYKDMKDTARAISSFQTALEQSPDYQPAVVQLGLIYSARKDQLAIKYLDKAYKIDSNDVFPIFARGVYYQNANDFTRAKEEYKKCIIRNTHYIDAYFNLGYIYMQQDSVEKAFRQYDIVVRLQPDNPTAYYDRGICNEMQKKLKEAVVDYRRALVLDTGYASPKAALKRLGLNPNGSPTVHQ